MTPILDLGHRIALELDCELRPGHVCLLASKITKQGVRKNRRYSRLVKAFDVEPVIGTPLTTGSAIWSAADKRGRYTNGFFM